MSIKTFSGILFAVSLFLSSFLGIVFMTCWSIPIFFVRPKIYRRFLDVCIGWWECFCSALLEYLLGIRIVITGDDIKPGERCLILMNHRTRLDWMYFWNVLVRMGAVYTEKIILKAPLKHVPGAGWAMQCASFIFLDRKWEKDKLVLSEMLDYFAHLHHPSQILLFPEGTDLTAHTKSRSDEFARKNGLPLYDYVLHPRVTGFNFLAKEMSNRRMLDAIYDVSIAYPQHFPTREVELVTGSVPEEVHFHIKRYSVENLATDEESLADWCRQRWLEKEAQLKSYYEGPKKFDSPVLNTGPMENRASMVLKLAMFYWVVFIFGSLLLLYFSWQAKLFLVCQVIFFLYMGYKGGWEVYQARYANAMFKRKNKIT